MRFCILVFRIFFVYTVADLGGGPLWPKIFSISCSFSQNLAKAYVGAPPPPRPGGLVPPPTGNPGSAPGIHGHASDAADHLATISRMGSVPAIVKISEATARLLIAMRLPVVEEYMDEVLQKQLAVKEACKKDEKPIEEIALQQNIPKNMREWNFRSTKEGRANCVLSYVDIFRRQSTQIQEKS